MSVTADLTWVDYCIIAVFVISILHAVWRGVIREGFALLGWILAIVAVCLWRGDVAAAMPADWSPAVRTAAASASLFLGVMILMGLAGWALSQFVQAIGLGLLDRMLGALFGVMRGFVIVLVVVVIATHTPLKRANAWESAAMLPFFVASLELLEPWLPGGRLPLQLSANGQASSGPLALE
jgi:membrane protein required for colicin V production